MVEHELDKHLRRKFRNIDDDGWEILVADNGPLNSFYSKILLGRAFKLYNDKAKDDLNIVRTVRNTFAHSKKLLDFDDSFICDELADAKHISRKFAKDLTPKSKNRARTAKAAYISLCFALTTKLLKLHTRTFKASAKYYKRKVAKSPFGRALFGSLSSPPKVAGFPLAASQAGYTGDPIPGVQAGLLAGIFGLPPKSGGSEGK